ncbi:hypothetical protein C900_03799 [Fulvivirga imtechensis AK7]|uniref:Diphthamide synthase domain-containing protein n=1 Tax=Fulvivirga imtechensis AK7 TaxID=1237149 RepID=L8JRJ7_9BACT|nr:diphthine--ammonia ligase [Fulvivirga imtechensis]ELR70114.1 hypothetical protein C900_03799 [Fulvivirga imtechensis AK7]
MNKKKISISWSGGKDSAYALYQLLQSREYEIDSLHTVFDADLKRVGLHGVPEHLIEAQAQAIGFPLRKIYLSKDNSHDTYERTIREFCLKLKAQGIDHVMYGDIFLEDLKAYRDLQLGTVDMEGVYPIWKLNTRELMLNFINDGFKTCVCAANTTMFDKSQAGKTIDDNWLNHLPENVDPCGENGEFHTFVYDGPLFKQPVKFTLGDVVEKTYEYKKTEDDGTEVEMKSSFWFQDIR